MSIPYSGVRSASAGLISAIAKQINLLKFNYVNKIVVKFDPFHENVSSTRSALNYISARKLYRENPACELKTNIVCDRSEPTITFHLKTNNKVIFKCQHLSVLEILKYCNKHVSSLVPLPEKTAKELMLEEKIKNRKPRYLKIRPLRKRRGVFL